MGQISAHIFSFLFQMWLFHLKKEELPSIRCQHVKVNNVFHGIGVCCLIETVAFEPSEAGRRSGGFGLK